MSWLVVLTIAALAFAVGIAVGIGFTFVGAWRLGDPGGGLPPNSQIRSRPPERVNVRISLENQCVRPSKALRP